MQKKLFFLDYAPVIFTSAKSGFHLDRLLEAVRYVTAQLQQKIPTAILNRTLRDAVERRQPVSAMGHRLKFFYATQVRQAPPTFLLFVNRDELFSDQYKKYLANQMRRAFGYEGCPIVLAPKARPKTVEPIRKPKPSFRKQPGSICLVTQKKIALSSCSQRRISCRLGNADAGFPRFFLGNIVRVTFLKIFLVTTICWVYGRTVAH